MAPSREYLLLEAHPAMMTPMTEKVEMAMM
jgi:hypothetical protein